MLYHGKRSKKEGAVFFKEKGSVLVVALLILVFLTLIGISATTTSEIEIQIAGNEKFHKIAFYHADSGVYLTPKLIRQCIEEGAQPSVTNITFLDAGSDDFYREVMGYDAHDSARDIRFTLGGNNVDVDVDRTKTETLPGGGVEFGAGAEGVGGGSTGGMAIYYTIDSLGAGPSSAQSNIDAVYRMVPGVAGGL